MLGTETVVVRRRGGTDPDGDQLPDTEPVPPVEGCVVEPLGGAELLEVQRTGATSAVRVLLPITQGIDAECELRVRGLWYRIVGDAVAYIDPEDAELSGYSLTCTRGRA